MSVMGEEKHNSSWVVDMEKMLADDDPQWRRMQAERWEAQSIYRVPEWLKRMNAKAYQPRLVSLGPFHHGDSNLLPMEEHKRRALVHLIKRSKKPLQDFISAIDDVAEELQAAYGVDLHGKWRTNRETFIDMMLMDGCFLLEMMSGPFQDYKPHDPVFSMHGRKQIHAIILSDMLLTENQLPLLVLKKILGVLRPNYPVNRGPRQHFRNLIVLECLRQGLHEGHDIVEVFQWLQEVAMDIFSIEVEMDVDINLMVQQCKDFLTEANTDNNRKYPPPMEVFDWLLQTAADIDINLMVLSFQGRAHEGHDIANMSLRLHPLELYHGSLTYSNGASGVYNKSPEHKYEMMPSAFEIHEAGIKFKKRERGNLVDIDFKRGVLSMPVTKVVDSTESLYLNLMAFERLHVGAGDLVTAYVIFMDNIIVSAKDVEMLSSNGVLKNMLGCNEEAAKLFNGTLSRGQVLGPCPGLHKVQYDVKAYCRKPWHKWRATLIRTYFRNPWTCISLAAAAILLIATLLQTIYTMKQNMS
ncbi:hypothetical protein CFC21_100866 [Triticum aestivum]|uniref:Uncharacterized protein n=2 Tax=Triticum aestivum TaxID=4565 RepID=A0A3B6RTC0_WHEAT|nr:UPF0481 protein At3g47200-like isoform X2 [Triticum aestivum]KAF7099201.1 hypothetical protein CFC21_100866 [Triticum aestivum]